MYDYLKQKKRLILNDFDKAGITEAVTSANEVFMRTEKTFKKKEHCRFFFVWLFLLLKKTIEILKYMCLYFSYF